MSSFHLNNADHRQLIVHAGLLSSFIHKQTQRAKCRASCSPVYYTTMILVGRLCLVIRCWKLSGFHDQLDCIFLLVVVHERRVLHYMQSHYLVAQVCTY